MKTGQLQKLPTEKRKQRVSGGIPWHAGVNPRNQVRDASLAAYTHQELPFDKLVEELQPKRAPGRNPIFQAILAFQNAAPQTSLAKVSLPAGAPVSADVKFDLEVHLSDGPEGVRGWFVYSPELFEPAFIERMVFHFQRLFEKAMAEPDSELSLLSLLDQAEYRQVVEEWNETAAPVPVVFDHFGGAEAALGTGQPGFDDLLALVKSGKAYVKISGAYRASKLAPDYADAAPLAQALIAANAERIVWGTDWPHPDSVTPQGKKVTDVTPLYQIDDGRLLNQLPVWAPDAAVRKAILVDNPARLYGFT